MVHAVHATTVPCYHGAMLLWCPRRLASANLLVLIAAVWHFRPPADAYDARDPCRTVRCDAMRCSVGGVWHCMGRSKVHVMCACLSTLEESSGVTAAGGVQTVVHQDGSATIESRAMQVQ